VLMYPILFCADAANILKDIAATTNSFFIFYLLLFIVYYLVFDFKKV